MRQLQARTVGVLWGLVLKDCSLDLQRKGRDWTHVSNRKVETTFGHCGQKELRLISFGMHMRNTNGRKQGEAKL